MLLNKPVMILYVQHIPMIYKSSFSFIICTVEPFLRGHPDERPTPLERPLNNVNPNINVLISSPDERPPLLNGYIFGIKGVASQKGFHYIMIIFLLFCINILIIGHSFV